VHINKVSLHWVELIQKEVTFPWFTDLTAFNQRQTTKADSAWLFSMQLVLATIPQPTSGENGSLAQQ